MNEAYWKRLVENRDKKIKELKRVNNRLSVVNRNSDLELMLSTLFIYRYTSRRILKSAQIQELVVLLYLHKHIRASNYGISQKFPFINSNCDDRTPKKLLEDLVKDGRCVMVQPKKETNPHIKYYAITNIGNRFLREKLQELKNINL